MPSGPLDPNGGHLESVCKVPLPRGKLYGEDLAHQTLVWITVAGQHRNFTYFLPKGISQDFAKGGIVKCKESPCIFRKSLQFDFFLRF